MTVKTLEQVVGERPFPEYAAWWPVGSAFTAFMSEAIVSEWKALVPDSGALEPDCGALNDVREDAEKYIRTVYDRPARRELVEAFVHTDGETALQSGEFDALSYAFYRSAFRHIERHPERFDEGLERERRLFTIRVGKLFFDRLNRHLALDLPDGLNTPSQLERLSVAIDRIGRFLHEQGYLRSHFAFRFDVDVKQDDTQIIQHADDIVSRLGKGELAYALYEMGYPVILPSAVYLYHTIGEAQHHSSRTIENLFAEVGYDARETDDFDPIGYPSEMVVELWEIRRL
ncbi:MAG: hypothetical protein OXH02_10720 [Gemmatimonadetes bacterium]|nr:hypothetical protein [Gemmatimonadota bacterium]